MYVKNSFPSTKYMSGQILVFKKCVNLSHNPRPLDNPIIKISMVDGNK